MSWYSINNKEILKDGDLIVAKVSRSYIASGYKMGVYRHGLLWDDIVLENPDMWNTDMSVIDDVVIKFTKVGVNVLEELYNIN